MAAEQDNRTLDRLLGPRLGFVMPNWPKGVWQGLLDMAEQDGSSTAALVNQLQQQPEDPRWEQLVHLATVGYTRFHRHPQQLQRMTEELRDLRGTGPVAIWCAGCATGEEAYSLALCAQDAGVEAQIVATDVDAQALAFAERGVYPAERAFGLPFVAAGDGVRVPDALRSTVRFQRGSLTDGAPAPGRFHFIVCRNVLVYFGARKVMHMGRLTDYLEPGGSLVVAPAEALGELPPELQRELPLGWLRPSPDALTTSSIRPGAPVPDEGRAPVRRRRETRPLATPEMEDPLDRVALWSADGDFDKAEDALRDALESRPDDAVRWYLLGEVLSERGEVERARDAFSKAAQSPVVYDLGAEIDEETLHRAARQRCIASEGE